jgi:ribosome-associated protein
MKIRLKGARKIDIKGDYIRLDALLKYACLVSSGGEAKALIQSGEVFITGEPCLQRGRKVRPGDVVRHGGDIIIVGADGVRPCNGDKG